MTSRPDGLTAVGRLGQSDRLRTTFRRRKRLGASAHMAASGAGMVAAGMSPAPAVAALLLVLALGGCGEERQDAGAPSGDFELDVVGASFPARQSVAQTATMRLEIENTGDRTLPQVAVTVDTDPRAGTAPTAFGQASAQPGLADPDRPVWIVDRGPRGGASAYVNTWATGPLPEGETRAMTWRVTAVQPGRYTLTWRVAPALVGDVRLTGPGRTEGSFRVTISDAPVPATVGPGDG
jgi:hypothetical protein